MNMHKRVAIIACLAMSLAACEHGTGKAATYGDFGYVAPVVRLTPAQVRQVRANFLFVRVCPSEMDPYAIDEKGGDCLGGESGAPSQSGGGGGD